jgi:hypothetical protein
VSHRSSVRSCATFLLAILMSAPPALAAQTRPAPTVNDHGAAASRRPIPGAVYESAEFTRAVANGTRTRTGAPGPRYWTQHPRYTIDAELDPATSTLTGSERVVYVNRSPDTLAQLAVHLRQNAFRAGSPRRGEAPVTDGMTLKRVAADGTPLSEHTEPGASGYTVDATVMWITLAAPLLPRDSVTLEIAWSYIPPLTPSDGRQGRDDHLYFLGYWYPQIAVYDDVSGWVADPYLLQAEFYMEHADYDVRVTV